MMRATAMSPRSYCVKRARPVPRGRPRAGYTLIELMVGLGIGLVTTLAITQILLTSEVQRRSTAAAAEAQANGVLAMDMLRTSILAAGYGFSSATAIIGCPLSARYNGAPLPGFPSQLVPLAITSGAGDAPDSIRVLASGKSTLAVPMAVMDPAYDPTVAAQRSAFHVQASPGVQAGDLLLAATDANSPCQVFQASAVPNATQIDRLDQPSGWNAAGFPDQAYAFSNHALLFNLGEFSDVRYSVDSDGNLQTNVLQFNAAGRPSYSGNADTYTNIVTLKAYYGKASLINGTTRLMAPVDTWDKVTPSTHNQWLQLLAVRIALVSRSDHYEKTEVTTGPLQWDVGASAHIAGTSACGNSQCVSLPIPHPAQSSDWKHYRYKLIDSVIPLRNLLWNG